MMPNRRFCMRAQRLAACFVLGSALLATISGCGNSLSKVSGQVTMAGEPIAGGDGVRATVYFYPEGGIGTPAIGILDSDGRYEIATGSQTGMEPGAYVVTISATQIIPSKGGGAPSGRRITAPKYGDPKQSGFRVEVGKGSNEFDFDLEPPVKQRRRR